MTESDLRGLASQTVRAALDAGASGAECSIAEGGEFSVQVRMREMETLKEAGSRAAGLRVLAGQRSGSAYTSDLTAEGIRRMVTSAFALAAITSEDPHAGLPAPEDLGSLPGTLELYHDDVAALDTGTKIQMARDAEEAALAFDPRISNSEGATFGSHLGLRVFANSHGFLGSYRTSSCALSAAPVARQGESMERDYWFSSSRRAADLDNPADIGRTAAARALRRLGAVKVPTARVPVVFEPRVARSLAGNVFEAVHGMAVYRKASFLAEKLGQRVASENLTVIDDGTMPGRLGSAPFDAEGVATRRTVVIERGVLQSYLLNAYAARKLGLATTGNAARGLSGNTGIGHGNLYLERGPATPGQIIASVRDGFYVTELMGFGVNIVTGDFSRGAAGLWIRNGELAFPVAGVTIAGNLSEMLMNMEAAGSDLEFRGAVSAPTLLIREMTIAGN